MEFWKEKPLHKLNKDEWESLCDGCGLCCLNKFEAKGICYYTSVACRLLDLKTSKCACYNNRKKFIPDCISLSFAALKKIKWLPKTCAYNLLMHNKNLPYWHYLVSGDKNLVHTLGISYQQILVSEDQVEEAYDFIIEDLTIIYKQ